MEIIILNETAHQLVFGRGDILMQTQCFDTLESLVNLSNEFIGKRKPIGLCEMEWFNLLRKTNFTQWLFFKPIDLVLD